MLTKKQKHLQKVQGKYREFYFYPSVATLIVLSCKVLIALTGLYESGGQSILLKPTLRSTSLFRKIQIIIKSKNRYIQYFNL